MNVRSIAGGEFNRVESLMLGNCAEHHVNNVCESTQPLDLQEEVINAAEEMADILSVFGRFNKVGRKNDSADSDFVSLILDEQADEKLDSLIHLVAKLRDLNNLLNFARQFFPNDSDLMLALREMLLSCKLSELQKKKIKEAIADLEKFGDLKKMRSGINVGRLAKRFSEGSYGKPLSPHELRNSYLNFLELEMSAGFIYKDWVDVYGFENRFRLLAFTLSALVADMKANEPGIHSAEFGPLSAKLSDARVLYTLDQQLNENFANFPFREQMIDRQLLVNEGDIVGLYLVGLVDIDNFKLALKDFSKKFMSLLLIKQRATVIQTLRNIYNLTPEFLFVSITNQDAVMNYLDYLLHKMYKKEKSKNILNDYYK
ncbi:TPA: type III secretion system gatekeeper subunit SctW [Escherichia coli]|uniref:type III secretion system gatekeeper subunit SctW n=1 Tax=Escherichia coli TaxID=562 RepID=UPI000BE2F604|nr:type III secretion system gatekeeper subunit SctW [Escherichia coli]MBS9316444.1 type III secretion system gatekeeper subunit SctW [Escherichia coli]